MFPTMVQCLTFQITPHPEVLTELAADEGVKELLSGFLQNSAKQSLSSELMEQHVLAPLDFSTVPEIKKFESR